MKKIIIAIISGLLFLPAAAFGTGEIPGETFPPANRINPIAGPMPPAPSYSSDQTMSLTGTIRAVNVNTGDLGIIGEDGRTFDFRVTANTPVAHDLKPIQASDLIPGDQVRVYYDALFGQVQRVDRI